MERIVVLIACCLFGVCSLPSGLHMLIFSFFLQYMPDHADTSKMYDRWASMASYEEEDDDDDAYDDDNDEDDDEEDQVTVSSRSIKKLKPSPKVAASTAGAKKEEVEVDFTLELSKAFGVALDQNARMDTVHEGGQFALAGAQPGDVIIAAGTTLVSSLEEFKAAVAEHKREKHPKMVVTFKGSKQTAVPSSNKAKKGKKMRKGLSTEAISTSPDASDRQGASGSGRKRRKRSNGHGGDNNNEKVVVSAADVAAAESVTSEAVNLIMQGNVAGALPLFEKATHLNPQKVDLWANLGNVHRDSGRFDLAKQAYQRGLQLSPRNDNILASLQELSNGAASMAASQSPQSSRQPHEGLCDDGIEVEVTFAGSLHVL